MEQLLFYISHYEAPFQAPYKHLPSNKSLRKNNTKQKQLQEQQGRKIKASL
ncbi:TPA: DNA replication protein DnaD [Bacillus tropicus]|uniref:DNA replication protein DnaD n=1 Tax=Bacillus tropicus TaxID=2026188 RepID=UPI0013F4F0FF|nr:DNA replication protein DnaD [Bacillus tropicus]HDR7798526.1 DNA replication protein DnaD [Bacillus tropicus]